LHKLSGIKKSNEWDLEFLDHIEVA
jgi:hypothetical protein